MRFGEVPVAEAEGAILAHSLKLGTTALKKGRVLSSADVELIAAAGLSAIVVARLEPGDVGEDDAARRVAAAAAGPGVSVAAPFTGRANLHAEARGLLVFERARVDRLNLVDEAVTLGTLPPYTRSSSRGRWLPPSRSSRSPRPRKRSKHCVRAAIAAKARCCGWRRFNTSRSGWSRPGCPGSRRAFSTRPAR